MATKPKKITKKVTTHKKSSSHPKHFLKVYWPYIPVIVLVVYSMVFGVLFAPQVPRSSTLAYATSMSSSGLLQATNNERTANGLSALTLNGQLSSAAQAKANDMVARDYWSHNTPDGQEPWVFIDAAGYVYQKAGENLAYGFATSADAVVGWMNSPSHRANILDSAYREVGFGYANSENFVGSGQQTVVVAMYGNPLVYTPPAPTPAPTQAAPSTSSSPKPSVQQSTVTEPVEPIAEPVEEPKQELEPQKLTADRINQPVTTETPVLEEPQQTTITRLQEITNGDAPWSAVVVTVASFGIVIAWLVKHAVLVKRFVLSGEHFVAHHPILDLIVVIIAGLAVYLSQSSGVVL